MTPRRSDQRTVRRAHEREPEDPLTSAPLEIADVVPTESVPVRHLAHRMLEALS